jgi:RNA recognition motif-containing protein
MSNKLIVSNIPVNFDNNSLRGLFTQAGDVSFARVNFDEQSGESSKFAHVSMKNDEDADVAADMFDGVSLDGNTLQVSVITKA